MSPRQAPQAIAPGRKRVMFVAKIRHRVVAVAAPRMAAAEPREREPTALPCSVPVDRLARIIRAGGQMAAIDAEQRRYRPAIERRSARAGQPWPAGRRTARSRSPAPLGELRHARPNGDPLQPPPRDWPRSAQAHPRPRRTRAASRRAARLIVTHRLEHGEIGPFAVRRRPALLQHLAHRRADRPQLARRSSR